MGSVQIEPRTDTAAGVATLVRLSIRGHHKQRSRQELRVGRGRHLGFDGCGKESRAWCSRI